LPPDDAPADLFRDPPARWRLLGVWAAAVIPQRPIVARGSMLLSERENRKTGTQFFAKVGILFAMLRNKQLRV
jgi:hypothetical protein